MRRQNCEIMVQGHCAVVPKSKRCVPSTERAALGISGAKVDTRFLHSGTYIQATLDGTSHATKRCYENQQYLEQPIRIYLYSSGPVARERSRRSRGCSFCGLYRQYRLLYLAVRADSGHTSSSG